MMWCVFRDYYYYYFHSMQLQLLPCGEKLIHRPVLIKSPPPAPNPSPSGDRMYSCYHGPYTCTSIKQSPIAGLVPSEHKSNKSKEHSTQISYLTLR